MLHAARLEHTRPAWDRQSLGAYLGYGPQYLFLDTVERLDRHACRATFRVPFGSEWAAAHFRGFPVMPAALIAEGFGQAAALLFRFAQELGCDQLVLVTKIREAIFAGVVRPGDTLVYAPRLTTSNARAALVQGEVSAGAGHVARISAMLVAANRDALAAAEGRVP